MHTPKPEVRELIHSYDEKSDMKDPGIRLPPLDETHLLELVQICGRTTTGSRGT